MRPLRYAINITLDGCCDHREGVSDEESDRYCEGSGCSDQRGVDAMDDAIVAGNRATACFIVAGVGLGVAGVLWFVRPFDSTDPTPTQVGIGPGRVELRVRW